MATSNLKYAIKYDRLNRYIIPMLSTLALLLILYYVGTRAFPMLVVTEENYGAYFYPRAMWLFPHIIFSIAAILIGPFQFVPKFRNSYVKTHRKLGRVYIISVVFGGLAGMGLAVTSGVNLPYAVGLFGLGFTWAASATLAFLAIKNRKVAQHKEWMIRSYIITFAFVTFRFIEDILLSLEIGSQVEILVLMSWSSWAVPLFIGEMVMQGLKINEA